MLQLRVLCSFLVLTVCVQCPHVALGSCTSHHTRSGHTAQCFGFSCVWTTLHTLRHDLLILSSSEDCWTLDSPLAVRKLTLGIYIILHFPVIIILTLVSIDTTISTDTLDLP